MLRTTIGILALSALAGLSSPATGYTPQASKPSAAVKAQAPSKSGTAKKKTARSPKRAKRLPRYFGQLELTPEQRAEILAIQTRFAEELAELQEQMDKLKLEQDEEFQEVLKTTQKRKLKNLSRASKS